MIDQIRVYGSLLRASWFIMLEYRSRVILSILSGVFPLVMMMVWLSLVDEAGAISGWGRGDFLSYYVAIAGVELVTRAWVLWEWNESIRLGSLSTRLLKPASPALQLILLDTAGDKILKALAATPIIVLVAWLVPEIQYATTPGRLVIFAISCLLGLVIGVLLESIFGVLAFWTTQSQNLYGVFSGVGQFLSGYIAPLALFPPVFQQIATLLPFRSQLSLPVEILMGRLSWPDIWSGLGVTVGWIVALMIVFQVLWRRGIRRYESVGA